MDGWLDGWRENGCMKGWVDGWKMDGRMKEKWMEMVMANHDSTLKFQPVDWNLSLGSHCIFLQPPAVKAWVKSDFKSYPNMPNNSGHRTRKLTWPCWLWASGVGEQVGVRDQGWRLNDQNQGNNSTYRAFWCLWYLRGSHLPVWPVHCIYRPLAAPSAGCCCC